MVSQYFCLGVPSTTTLLLAPLCSVQAYKLCQCQSLIRGFVPVVLNSLNSLTLVLGAANALAILMTFPPEGTALSRGSNVTLEWPPGSTTITYVRWYSYASMRIQLGRRFFAIGLRNVKFSLPHRMGTYIFAGLRSNCVVEQRGRPEREGYGHSATYIATWVRFAP